MPVFSFTKPPSPAATKSSPAVNEKENKTVPTSSSASPSLFQNLLNKLSPLKMVSSTFGPFSPFKSNETGTGKGEKCQNSSSSTLPAQISGNSEEMRELLKLRDFCHRMGRKSPFIRKQAQILGRQMAGKQLALLQQQPLDQLLLLPLAPKKGQHSLALAGAPPQHQQQQLSRIERAVVAKKHALSRQFQRQTALASRVQCPSSAIQKLVLNSGDSLTFEFFNTIAPFLPGSSTAEIDVFLCGLNSVEGKVHFWKPILSFLSPVNQKTRQNQVLEIWVPHLADFCDELLLVAEGRVMEEAKSTSGNEIGQLASQIIAQSGRCNSSLAKMPMPMDGRRKMGRSMGKIVPKNVQKRGRKRQNDAENEKPAKKRRKKSAKIEDKEKPAFVALERQKEEKANSPQKQWHNTNAVASTVPMSKSPVKKTSPVKKQPSTPKKPLMVFRGFKTIGKWANEENEGEEEKDGTNGEHKRVFQPIYTYNGMILNVLGTQTPKLSLLEAPDFAFVEELSQRTKTAAKGTCHMLQMEISNEHGYGGPASAKVPRKRTQRQPVPTKEDKEEKCQEIRYTLAKPTDLDASSLASSSPVSLNFLKSVPVAKQPLPCLFCSHRFAHIWELAFHLTALHPSMHFQFFLHSSGEGHKTLIEVSASAPAASHRKKKKCFAFDRSGAISLRKMLLSGQPHGSGEGTKEKQQNRKAEQGRGVEAVQPKFGKNVKRNAGKFFNGVLPFNKPTYVELASPPFPNLFGVDSDRGWLQDAYAQRLQQFTDVSAKEKLFFALWNRFVGSRPNRVLGVKMLPEMLTRFVDHFGEQLARDELLGNLVEHCGMLQKNEYISGQEMVDVLMYAEGKTAGWRKKK